MRKYAIILIGFLGVAFLACDEQSIAPDSMENLSFDMASGGGGERDSTKQKPPKLTPVELSDLAISITSYISTNYTAFSIKRAGTDAEGNFIVGISNETEKKGLRFDVNGTFVEELPERKKGEHGQRSELSEVNLESLPAAITSYVTENYSEASIEKAGTDPDGNYAVIVSIGEKKKGLLFNADGSFNKELPPPPRKKRN